MKKLPVGSQLAIELYGCDSGVLDDVDAISRHMLGAANACGATIVGHNFHRFRPQGVSGVVIIAESHLAVHTWPELHYAAVDVFTCGTTLQAEQAVTYLREAFQADDFEVTRVSRGLQRLPELRPALLPPLRPELFRYDDTFVARFVPPRLAAPRAEQALELVSELAEQVYEFPLLTPDFCSLLIEEVEHRRNWLAEVAETLVDREPPETRVSLAELPGATRLWAQLIRHHVQPLLESLWPACPLERWAAPVVQRREPELSPPRQIRPEADTVRLLGLLNTDFAGGGTHFPRWGLTVGDSASARVGRFILHPSGVSHQHRTSPVTSGREYTLASSFF